MTFTSDPTLSTILLAAIAAILVFLAIADRLLKHKAARPPKARTDRLAKQLNPHHQMVVPDLHPTVFVRPLPLLDELPPHFAIYAVHPADPPTLCSCHGNQLTDGDRILIWPYEALLCQDTYGAFDLGSVQDGDTT